MTSYLQWTGKHLRKQKRRTLLAIIGIVLSMALFTGIGTILASMQDKFVRDAIREAGDWHYAVEPVSRVQADRLLGNVRTEAGTLIREEGVAALRSEPDGKGGETARYMKVSAVLPSAFDLMPWKVAKGRLPQNSGEILVEEGALSWMPGGKGIGDTVELKVGVRADAATGVVLKDRETAANETVKDAVAGTYTIVGTIKPVVFDSRLNTFTVLRLLDGNQDASGLTAVIRLKSVRQVHEDAARAIAEAGIDRHETTFNDKVLRYEGQSISKDINMAMGGILFFIVGLVVAATAAVIYNVFHISVMERIAQFGILRCIGASPGQIRAMVMREACILAGIGIPIGVFCGTAAMALLFKLFYLIDGGLAFGDLRVVVEPWVVGASAFLGLVTILLSAWGPAHMAGRISPIEAIRSTGQMKGEVIKRSQPTGLLYRLLGIEGSMAWKNMGRNRKRFAVTVFSMVISAVLFIVFSGFSDLIFKSNVIGSEMNVAFQANSQEAPFTDAQMDELGRLQGVRTVYRNVSTEVSLLLDDRVPTRRFRELRPELAADPDTGMLTLPDARLLCVGDAALAELGKDVARGALSVPEMERNNGVLVLTEAQFEDPKKGKSVMLEALALSPGDTFGLRTTGGSGWSDVHVQAVLKKGPLMYTRAGNGGAIVLVTEKQYEKWTGTKPTPKSVYIGLTEGADRAPVRDWMERQDSARADFNWVDFDEMGKEMNSTLIILCIFIYGFVTVVALIGSLNIINTINTNLILRTRELSTMRAVGMTMGGMSAMILYESIFQGLIASVIGGVAGALLTWWLFGIGSMAREVVWTIPWGHIEIAAAGVVLISVLSTLAPLRRLRKGNIMEQIRMQD